MISEHTEQCTLVLWLELKNIKFTSIPNSTFSGSFFNGKKTKNYGLLRKLHNEGLRNGLPDLFIICPCGDLKKRGIFIEMKRKDLKPKKTGKGGVKNEQREWISSISQCESMGAFVCYGSEDAIYLIDNFMKQTIF